MLSREEREAFDAAKDEFTSTNRLYCHNPDCGKFIRSDQIREGQRGECLQCGEMTCVHCKCAFHLGACENDENHNALLALANDQNWKICYKCKNIVELTKGCFHMT
jgi:hypothetical protein